MLKTDAVVDLMQGSIYQSAAAGRDTSTSPREHFRLGHLALIMASVGALENII